MVKGENCGGVESQRRFEVEGVERAKVSKWQEPGAAIHRPVDCGERNTFEQAGHVSLFEFFARGEAAKLGFEQVAGDDGRGCLVEPFRECLGFWLRNEQGAQC